ncbi:MAG: YggT family protein [Patescibacteria group bacterium]
MEATKSLYKGAQIVWYLLTIIEAVLLLRFVLRLLQANPGAGFTDFVYGFSGLFTGPFEAVFRNLYVEGSVFEWTTLLAMLVYWIIAIGIVRLLAMGRPVSSTEAQEKLGSQDQI